jgi:hypothetical protein
LLFSVCCSAFVVQRLLFSVCCSAFVVQRLLFSVCYSAFVFHWSVTWGGKYRANHAVPYSQM